MRKLLYPSIILLSASLTGCSTITDYIPSIYTLDIQQGNVINQDMVDQLKPGMTKRQVLYIMGSAMLVDAFHQKRWDYLHSEQLAGEDRQQKRLSLFFNGNKLSAIQGDFRPSTQPVNKKSNETTVIVPPRDLRKTMGEKIGSLFSSDKTLKKEITRSDDDKYPDQGIALDEEEKALQGDLSKREQLLQKEMNAYSELTEPKATSQPEASEKDGSFWGSMLSPFSGDDDSEQEASELIKKNKPIITTPQKKNIEDLKETAPEQPEGSFWGSMFSDDDKETTDEAKKAVDSFKKGTPTTKKEMINKPINPLKDSSTKQQEESFWGSMFSADNPEKVVEPLKTNKPVTKPQTNNQPVKNVKDSSVDKPEESFWDSISPF